MTSFFFTDNNSLRNDVWNLAIIFGDDEKCGDNHFLQSYKLPSSSWKTRNMMINHTKRLKFTWTVRGDEKNVNEKKQSQSASFPQGFHVYTWRIPWFLIDDLNMVDFPRLRSSNLNEWIFPFKWAGWWFQPLWKILVNWDDYSQYMEKMFQSTNQWV